MSLPKIITQAPREGSMKENNEILATNGYKIIQGPYDFWAISSPQITDHNIQSTARVLILNAKDGTPVLGEDEVSYLGYAVKGKKPEESAVLLNNFADAVTRQTYEEFSEMLEQIRTIRQETVRTNMGTAHQMTVPYVPIYLNPADGTISFESGQNGIPIYTTLSSYNISLETTGLAELGFKRARDV